MPHMNKTVWMLSVLLVLVVLLSACVREPVVPTEPTTVPTASPTAEPTEAPTTEPTEPPTTEPATEPPSEPPTEEPTEARADIQYFQQLLAFSNGHTENGYNAALNCTFEKPEDLDLGRFFWSHFETGENWEDLTDAEVAYLNSRGLSKFDLSKYSAETMDAVLREYFGLPLSAFQDPPMVYYAETNCYYTTGTSPLISHLFEVTEVEYGEDGIVKVYYWFDPQAEVMGKYVLTLQEKTGEGETGYYILSHLRIE